MKGVLHIYQMMTSLLDFGGCKTDFGATSNSRCIRASSTAQRITQRRNNSIMAPFVEFEDGLPISVVKNRVTRHQNSQLEIVRVLKKVKWVQTPPAHSISHPVFCWSRLLLRVSKLTEAFSKQ
jgi:hypothetical protein